jgi:hypothetical protein
VATLVKICSLLLRATAVRISGILLRATKNLRGKRSKISTTARELSDQLVIKPCPLHPTLAQGGCVNYGGGSQGAKDAREKSASRRREQQRARETARTYQRPTPLEEADRFHTALLTPLGAPMLKDLPEADPVPTGLYSKAYLASQFNSEVGPGGYPCVGFNQPLLWYPINLDPPAGHAWACRHWDSMSAIFIVDFDRIQRADTNRLELYDVSSWV